MNIIMLSPGWRRWRLLVVPLVLVATAALALAVDLPIAAWCVQDDCPRFARRLFEAAEPFGNGIGVAMIVLAIASLDPRRRRMLPRVLAMSLGAGLVANSMKLLVARVRPESFSFHGTVGDTFGPLLPLLAGGTDGQSFPSAHTATAVGLAMALSWLYPRGRGLFVALAILVACQRVASSSHYVSDTLVGAAVGWLMAAACLRTKVLAGRFERWEHKQRTHDDARAASSGCQEDRFPSHEAAAAEGQSRAA